MNGRAFSIGEADLNIHGKSYDRTRKLTEINAKFEAKKRELESRGLYIKSDEYPIIEMVGVSGSSRQKENKKGGVSRRTRKKKTKKRRGRLFLKKNRSINININNKTR